jgi:hypothetical protein
MSGATARLPVPGRLLYRCRLCGVLADRVRVPDIIRAVPAIVEVGRAKVAGTDVPARMTDVHACENGRLGVADLIGAVEDRSTPESSGIGPTPLTPWTPLAHGAGLLASNSVKSVNGV